MPAQPRDPRSVLAGLGLSGQADAIIAGEARLAVLTMTAHMDWDWLLPFSLLVAGGGARTPAGGTGVEWYFEGKAPAASILGQAATFLAKDPGYRYSVCEMGFLRAFAQVDPDGFDTLRAQAERVHLAGAGITSPDSLLPHGEAFIRNYLVGRVWAAAALPGATISQSYLPDDFGHDPELPVTLAAMGMAATGFARLPGAWTDPHDASPPDGAVLQALTLFDQDRIDFIWAASDGSTILAHWMPSWYSGGASVDDFDTPACLVHYLRKLIGPGGTGKDVLAASPTQYVYVPLGDDFGIPFEHLAATCRASNQHPPTIDGKPVYCAAGTFDDFVQLASSEAGGLATLGAPGGTSFYTTPYMAGAYASRPLLKILHHRAVRALLAAETFAAIAAATGAPVPSDAAAIGATSPRQSLLDAWNLIAPSTHHDFITGTAHPNVYRSEQLPLLRAAVSTAEWLREDAMAAIAATLPPNPQNASVAVFNQLGFARTALAECDPNAIGGASGISCGDVTGPVQPSAEGGALFLAGLPSLGCATASGAAATASQFDAVKVTPEPATGPQRITLENGQLSVVLAAASNWDVDSVLDKGNQRPVVAGPANEIAIFRDGGDEYALGCEQSGGTFADSGVKQTVESVEILESGPLRGRVRVTSTCAAPGETGETLTFVREYALVAGESMLRMELTGRAPLADGSGSGTTVMAKLPLTGPIDTLERGTPTHWTDQMPQLVWEGFTPYAPHHYAVAYSGATPLGGVLHADVPACGLIWSYSGSSWSNDGALHLALLRNTTGGYYNWTYDKQPFPGGTDYEVHTRRYALLVPSAIGPGKSGAPRRAGLHFATPPTVAPLSDYAVPADPPEDGGYSLAQVTGPAVITAAKLGSVDPSKPGATEPSTLVVRLYQPTNALLTGVTVTFLPQAIPGWSATSKVTARLVTALEEPVAGVADPTVSGSTFTIDMPRSIATVALSVAP